MDTKTLEYEFFAPPRVVFGWGRRRSIGDLARPLGKRACLVLGSRSLAAGGVVAELAQSLSANGVSVLDVATISREPLVEDVDRAADFLRRNSAGEGDFILAVGGGSALDLGKAAAALATNPGSVIDYLEGVGTGRTLEHSPLPVLAVPTTAGTGSEATKNAVISSVDPPFKKSLRSPQMVPRAVLVDPELTVSVPRDITIYTGMDAITQLIESYISRRAQPIPQALAIHGLKLALPAIRQAASEPTSRQARENMSHAALLSGIALANSGLGMAHGVAAALGIHCGVTHGLACAVMLPVALRVNRAAAERSLAELGEHVLGARGTQSANADQFIEHLEQLCAELKIPTSLRALGVTADRLPALVQGSRGNSMDGNPRELSDHELRRILEDRL